MFFEFVFVDETFYLQRAEEVADAFAEKFSIVGGSRLFPKACFEFPKRARIHDRDSVVLFQIE